MELNTSDFKNSPLGRRVNMLCQSIHKWVRPVNTPKNGINIKNMVNIITVVSRCSHRTPAVFIQVFMGCVWNARHSFICPIQTDARSRYADKTKRTRIRSSAARHFIAFNRATHTYKQHRRFQPEIHTSTFHVLHARPSTITVEKLSVTKRAHRNYVSWWNYSNFMHSLCTTIARASHHQEF